MFLSSGCLLFWLAYLARGIVHRGKGTANPHHSGNNADAKADEASDRHGKGQLFRYAKDISDEKRQQAVRVFAHLNLIVYLTGIALSLLSKQNSFWAAVYVLAFFSANLIPLLFWRSYLEKHAVAPSLQKAGPEIMKLFLEDYKISKREEEVIQKLCAGRTNKEISEALFISLQTVKDHVYRIYQKTDVKNRVQLINLIQSYKSKGEDLGR